MRNGKERKEVKKEGIELVSKRSRRGAEVKQGRSGGVQEIQRI